MMQHEDMNQRTSMWWSNLGFGRGMVGTLAAMGLKRHRDRLQDNARGPLLATETRDATIVPRELRLFCPTGGKKRGGCVCNQQRPHQPAVLRSMSRATVSSARASMSGRASVAASMSAMVVSSWDTRRSISRRCCRTVSTRLEFSD
jgi:hypothetical protein